jgi:hypothetical protein
VVLGYYCRKFLTFGLIFEIQRHIIFYFQTNKIGRIGI